MNINRRSFLSGSAMLAGASLVAAPKKGKIELPPPDGGRVSEKEIKLVMGEPNLQAPAATTMGVTWCVNCLANGWVDVSESPDLSNSKRFMCGGYGVTGFDDRVLQVRLTGLKPGTKYYYRIGATHIDYVHNYKRYALDSAEGKIYSFTTAGENGKSHFCVMNDTHARWDSFEKITRKITELAPGMAVWNGDATNTTENEEVAVQIFLDPKIPNKDYASQIPVSFVNGNHDLRGRAMQYNSRYIMTRIPSERTAEDWALVRNWAVRQGDIAMIGLDTGEDKPDNHPQFVGLVNCNEYRKVQGEWLERQFERPEIKNAPFVVAFCHIPLFDRRPNANPGDILEGYASWQRPSANAWGPVFNKYGVQAVVAAHTHRYRYDAPEGGRKWAQVVGGSPRMHPNNPKSAEFPTVIEGKVENGKLVINVHNITTGAIHATHTFAARV